MMVGIMASRLNPDFTVLQMSPALFHARALGALGRTVLQCLERNQVVRVDLVSQEATDVAATGNTLVVVASPFPELLQPRLVPPSVPQSSKSIRDYIGGLIAENPRASHTSCDGFVCPGVEVRDGQRTSTLIYNHNTSHQLPSHSSASEDVQVDLDEKGVLISCDSPYALYHPGKLLESPHKFTTDAPVQFEEEDCPCAKSPGYRGFPTHSCSTVRRRGGIMMLRAPGRLPWLASLRT